MSWGVATQNGVSVSLASIVSLSCGATEFSPASLFTSGVAGAWYDPSDYSTLFQDSAGTTPVTAVEQPVGLMLDKSQGLAITATAIDGNLNTATWTKGTGWSAPSARSLVCDGSQTGSSDTSASYTKPTGALVRWSFTISAISGALSVYPTGGNPATITTTGAKTVVSDASSNFNIFRMGAGSTCTITDIRIEIIAGNHASQATAASRPVLRARYNLLTYSEQFDNAAWVKMPSTTVVANQAVAPDGTNTAELLYPTTTGTFRGLYQTFTASAVSYTTSLYAKAAGLSTLGFSDLFGSVVAARFDLNAGTVGFTAAGYTASIQSVGNGWYRCSVTGTAAAALQYVFPYVCDSTSTNTATASGTSGIYIWGADLRTGTSAGTYQRIAAATDYATTGFLPYLALDGTDDSFGTNSIDFSATDKMFVSVGITKLSDANTGTVIDLNGVTATGAFMMRAPSGASTNYVFYSGGTAGFSGATATPYVSPITNVVSGIGNISGDQEIIRINGAQVAITTGDQGTGNYSNLPIYIGRRQGTLLPFNGRIYQMVVCGKTLSASELASTEAYVNSKTGAY